jgi:Tfp pilus assembly protein PilF
VQEPRRKPSATSARTAGGAPTDAPLLWHALLVAATALALYLPALRYGLVWDDPHLLAQVDRATHDRGAAGLLRSEFQLFADRPTGYYRPVVTLSLWADTGLAAALGGDPRAQRARVLHATNLGLHVACSVLLLLLVRSLAGAGWPATVAALLFAAHPAHVESVAFVSGRTDLWAALFAVLAMLAWLRARRAAAAAWPWIAASGATLLLATLSKETAFLLPGVLLGWDTLIIGEGAAGPRKWWRRMGPGLLAWAVAIALALALRGAAGVGEGAASIARAADAAPRALRLVLPALLTYLRLLLLPRPLNAYYTPAQLAVSALTLAACMIALLAGGLCARRGRGRLAAAGLLASVVFLLPVVHFVPLQGAAAAERFLYLPSVGLALVAAATLQTARPSARSQRIAWILAGGVTVACALGTLRRLPVWQSEATLFADMVRTSPGAPVAHYGLASVLADAGRDAEAVEHYRETLRLKPDHVDALNGLGTSSTSLRNYDEARRALETAIRLRPEQARAYTNLGIACALSGDDARAIELFRRAVVLDPGDPKARFNFGLALVGVGQADSARVQLAILQQLDARMAERLQRELQR